MSNFTHQIDDKTYLSNKKNLFIWNFKNRVSKLKIGRVLNRLAWIKFNQNTQQSRFSEKKRRSSNNDDEKVMTNNQN